MVKDYTHRLSDEFLSKYKDKEAPWGPIGYVTYKRTYARWIPSENRSEEWWETCRRVIEWNHNLVPNDPTVTQEGMERAYDLMFRMLWLPPGRGLWIGGTDSVRRNGASAFNCWGISVRPGTYFKDGPLKASMPFVFAMDQLMLGGGVGFSVTRNNIEQFDPIRREVELVVVCDPKHPNVRELNSQPIPPRTEDHTYIRVKDSRRGWTDALRVIIDAHFKNGRYDYKLVLDVSDVRRAGARIKGFGGTSAGPGPLVVLLREVNDRLNSLVGKKMSSVDASDLMNFIGKCVIAGNVRRSAELSLGDADDDGFVTMKLDKDALLSHRWASNNSVAIDDSFENFDEIAAAISTNGEPGIINLERFRHYGRFSEGFTENIDKHVEIVNPCSEIGLFSGEPCCLVEIFPAKVAEAEESFEEIARLSFLYAKRVTFAPQEWEISRNIIEQNRRVGVSISGWEDWKGLLAVEYGPEGAKLKRREILDSMYKAIRDEDKRFSAALGCSESIKVTTVKPSGSISLLNGSSAGRHPHYSKYYIRRIRFSHTDPIVEMLRDCNFNIEDDVSSPNTVVVEFPVKALTADLPGFKCEADYSLEEQCEDQMELQTYWADNSVSSTLKFKSEEVPQIPHLLKKYKFKSTSLLPYSGHGYVQAPLEPITEEQYHDMLAVIKDWPSEFTFRSYKEKRDMEILQQDECEGGACPIR